MDGGFRQRGALAAVMVLWLLVAGASAARAQTVSTWTGGGSDNNWSTNGNWSGAGVPSGDTGNNVAVFSGTNRPLTTNDLGDWSRSFGQLYFASGAASFTLSGNTFGFRPYLGSGTQQIFQNSANTQTIGVSAFSFRNAANSQINLNAGDLVISSPNMYIDMSSSATRSLVVTGTDSTRRTVTFAGNVNKGDSGNDPDMYIQGNKRALVTGSLTFGTGNDGSVYVDDGVLQFSGAGTMTGGRPVIGSTGGSGNAAVWLDTAGATFGQQLEVRNGSSGRRTIGGLNTSGTVTFSGDFAGDASSFDLAAATGGAANFSGVRNFNSTISVNRPDGATTYGGTVILSGTTSSTGATALHAGTLQFSNWNQLGSDFVEFNASSGDSGTLRYTGGSATTTRTLWLDNTGITRAAIDVSEAGTTLTWNPGGGTRNQNLTKTGAGWLFFGGGISGGTVGIEAGLMVLSASNSYSGGTVVSGGTLEVSAGGSQGGSPAGLGTGTVSIASGGQVKYWLSQSGSNTVANPFSLSGGTLHTTDGYNTYSGRITLASGASTISAQYEDTITMSGGLAGSGDVLFTQSGGTGSWAAPTYVLTGTGANTGTVRVNGSSGGVATKLQLTNVNALQSATLDLATGDTGMVEFTVAGTNTYALGGLRGGRNLAFGSNALSVGGNGQTTAYSGDLSGSGLFTKDGSGTLTLSGSNSASGGVTIGAGVLALGSANALGTSGTISFGGGTLQYSASNTTDYSGRFSTAANQQFRIDTNGRSVTLASNLASVNGQLVKLGSGTLTLSGSNSYSGGTFVTAGRVIATTSQSFPGDVLNNAEVEFAVNGGSVSYGSTISGSGALIKSGTGELLMGAANTYSGGTVVTAGRLTGDPDSLQGTIANSGIVAIGRAGAGTFAGVVSGTGAVEVIGGNITFTGTSTYTGATRVNNGARLAVNGALGNTAVTVYAGGELGGSGAIAGALAILAGGTLSPGNSIASLIAGTTVLSGSSTFEYEYDSSAAPSVGADLLVVSGSLSIASGAMITFADLAGASQPFENGTSFALINYSGPWDGGFFKYGATTLVDGARFTVGTQQWEIDYNRTSSVGLSNYTADYLPSGSFVAITAVPEPWTVALALAGLACAGSSRRRRRRA